MPHEDADLLEELIAESGEHLTSIEPDLLALENEGAHVSSELVNRIFRAMHSIKGGFAFFGLKHIVDLSHSMESVLMRIRDGELVSNSTITDALLSGVDKLRLLLGDVDASEATSIEEEVAPLQAILGGNPTESKDQAEPQEAPQDQPTTPAIESVKPDADTSTGAPRKEKQAEGGESIRVKVGLLDNLMNLAGELVLGRNQIKLALDNRFSEAAATSSAFKRLADDLVRSEESVCNILVETGLGSTGGGSAQARAVVGREFGKLRDSLQQALALRLIDTPGMSAVMQDVDSVTSELQSGIMNTRMQPVGTVFAKSPRIMRDLSKKMGKEIELTLIGQDVELDKSIIEALADPLTHLVRNSADHGIELPSEREAAGKLRQGKVCLRAYHEGGQVNIDITDDGAGIDTQRLRVKAVERSLLTEEAAEKTTDREALRLIFAPGFSTAEVISDVSGRGVGMDVVRTNIERLGGTIDIESEIKVGTRINLRLPLTLAIIPSLIISAKGRRYAIPQVNLDEIVLVRANDVDRRIEEVRGKPVLRLRGKLLPLVYMVDLLGLDHDAAHAEQAQDQPTKKAQNVLVLKNGTHRYGLIVEKLLDSEEIVVKPLSTYLKECKHYAGATIMGDGRVVMILDAAGIAEMAQLRFGETKEASAAVERQLMQETEEQPLLLFRNGTEELFAISLAMVARIEKVRASEIEHIGQKLYVKYAHSSMRIIQLHEFLPVATPSEEPEEFFIIVPKLVKNPMGIIATRIEDIEHTDVEIEQVNIAGRGILGSAVLSGNLAVFLDVYGLFEAVDPELYGSGDGARDLQGARVLLAEDMTFFRNIVAEYFRGAGCIVTATKNGAQAWEHLLGGEYDILVTDIEMPVMDGFELAGRIRANEHFANLPIVALTALQSDAARRRGEEAGFDAYEIKLDKERILEALAGALRKRRGEQKWSGNSRPSSSEEPVSASTS